MQQHIIDGNLKIMQFHLQQINRDAEKIHAENDITMYNRNWNWLYPVIKLIEKLGYTFNMGPVSCEISKDNLIITSRDLQDARLAGTWQAVIDFIDYYKTQNT